jgi:hypothetical protein
MDVNFVHHMEEIDLCYRINLLGYKLMVAPESLVYHYGGGIISYDSYKKLYWNHRNSVFMLLKNMEFKNLIWIIPVRMMLDLMTFGWALTKLEGKRMKALLNAWIWLIFHPVLILKKRIEVSEMRKISDNQVFKLMYPKSAAIQYFFKNKKTYNELLR